MDTKLERIRPDQAGVRPEAVQGFLDQIKRNYVYVHSYMMIKGDRVFAEGSYAPCKPEDVHMLFSLSKSFTSTAAGFAVQEGLLSLTDRVVDFFKEELADLPAEAVCENMKKMTVRHLLTMSTGLEKEDDSPLMDYDSDWVKRFLTCNVEREPGSWFSYNTRSTYMVSVILEKLTGQSLFEYLKPRLFEPLGCSEGIWWEKSPQGHCTGGFGLNMTVEDIARFGIFVKGKGCFKGKRLLNEEWFEQAIQKWADTSILHEGEGAFGYGYQFWMNHIPGTFRGDGAFGQYCVILPEEDMLFVATGGQLDMQKILDAFWDNVYAECRAGSASGADSGACCIGDRTSRAGRGGEYSAAEKAEDPADRTAALREREANLVLPARYEEKGVDSLELVLLENVPGVRYELPDNRMHITSLKFEKASGDNACVMELGSGDNLDRFLLTPDRWQAGTFHPDWKLTDKRKTAFREGMFEKLYIKGCTRDGVLYVDVIFPETSYQDTWEITFGEKKLHLQIRRNAEFFPMSVDVDGVLAK